MSVMLQPGDVIVHGVGPDSGRVTRLIAKFTASPWTHVGLVVEHSTLIEAWLPRVRVCSPASTRLVALEAAGVSYRVLRPVTPLTPEQQRAMTDEAWALVEERYGWWQIAWYALTGWFGYGAKAHPICSALVARTYLEVGYPVWRPEALAALPGARRQQLETGWCTPGDVVSLGDFTVIAEYAGAVRDSKNGVAA